MCNNIDDHIRLDGDDRDKEREMDWDKRRRYEMGMLFISLFLSSFPLI
jgi:hypothetical protein